MKFLFDLFPVILFFIVFKWGKSNPDAAHTIAGQYLGALVAGGVVQIAQAPILLATTVVIVATFLQIAYLLVRRKKIDTMLWISLGIITVFGGATIYFHNDMFIKWKPTVLYWCFAVGLLISQYAFNKNGAQKMMGQLFTLPDALWTRLNLIWAAFFAALGVINLWVAYNFTESTWVNFKLFGATGLLFAFMVGQALLLSKYMKEPE